MNDQITKNSYGTPLIYGAEFFLKHINSGLFINGKIYASQFEKNAYKVELTDSLAPGMVFVFTPKFKMRKNGENV